MAKARRIVKTQGVRDPVVAERIACRIRDTRQPCSCQMCRNPRRAKIRAHQKFTMQERRQHLPEDND